MKYCVFLLVYVFLFFACSTNNRIVSGNKQGLKTLRLVQSADAGSFSENDGLPEKSAVKVSFDYRYEEIKQDRPKITLRLVIHTPADAPADSLLLINLDGESISLYATGGAFIIPENLWVPVAYAKKIQYHINHLHKTRVISLNEQQRDQLIQFFNRAIKLKDEKFPAIPQGQKKW